MNSSAFLRADGTIAPSRRGWWSGWLPTMSQIQQAIQLRALSSPDTAPDTVSDVWALSMRQGMGLVIVAALIAGFIPFLFNTVTALRVGAPLPFVELAQQTQSAAGVPPSELERAFGTLAGLQPAVLPGWLAALLSTVGAWINWPLRWLAWWLVYGTATLLAAKVWGAPTTLQWFLAVTSYAAVPLILVGLSPIPCLGFVAQIVAVAWMAAVYVTSVRAVTGLDYLRAAVAIILPAVVVSVLGFIVLLAAASTLFGMIFSG
jgi:hypothetical protein